MISRFNIFLVVILLACASYISGSAQVLNDSVVLLGDTLKIEQEVKAIDSIIKKATEDKEVTKGKEKRIVSAVPDKGAIKFNVSKKKEIFIPSPKKAVLYSIIPGVGHIYNRKYWKLPIILGGYVGCYYAITWNNNNLTEYANAYRDIRSDAPLENRSWIDFLPYNANPEDYITNSSFIDRLKRGRDFYRRNRDLSIIVSVAAYVLIMIDAYVDAELYAFDISPNVSLSYQPVVTPPTIDSPSTSYGVQFALRF